MNKIKRMKCVSEGGEGEGGNAKIDRYVCNDSSKTDRLFIGCVPFFCYQLSVPYCGIYFYIFLSFFGGSESVERSKFSAHVSNPLS